MGKKLTYAKLIVINVTKMNMHHKKKKWNIIIDIQNLPIR